MFRVISKSDQIKARDRLWIIRKELRVIRERREAIADLIGCDAGDSALQQAIDDIDRNKWSDATEDLDRLLSILGIAVESTEEAPR